jgi:hypothetical protein
MKAFKAYLTESTRRYDFRIRLACEMMDDTVDKIKQVLEMYKLDTISKPKRLPIQETPEFPNMGPVEVNIIDVSLCYPCTDAQVRMLIAECRCCEANCIRVTPTNSPYEAALAGLEQSNLQKAGESVLATQEMVTEKADDLVGEARIGNLMKEFAGLKKYEYPDVAGGKVTDKQFQSQGTSNDIPQGNSSPVGSQKSKFHVTPAGKGR